MTGAPTPTVQGNFRKTPFAHVLVYVWQQKITGTLVVREDGHEELIWIEQGRLKAASFSNDPESFETGLIDLLPKVNSSYSFFENHYMISHAANFVGDLSPIAVLSEGLRKGRRSPAMPGVTAKLRQCLIRLKNLPDASEFGLDQSDISFLHSFEKLSTPYDVVINHGAVSKLRAEQLLYMLGITKVLDLAKATPSQVLSVTTNTVIMPPEEPKEKTAAKQAAQKTASPAAKPNIVPKKSIPEMPTGLSSDEQGLWKNIVHTYEHLAEMNHFQLLGLSMEADSAAVSHAYMSQAKKWHPDKLPKTMDPLRSMVREVFKALTDAQKALANDKARQDYIELVNSGAGSPAEQKRMMDLVEAASEIQTAAMLLQQRNYTEALEHAKQAVRLAPNDPDGHTFYGWALYQLNAKNEDIPYDEILSHFAKTLSINPRHEKANFYKALIFKQQGKNAEALQLFKVVAKINPRNVDAARELRIASMRKSMVPEGQKSSRASVFSKLFKKPSDH
ncbi:MAG: DnaJ domain-containing protein [Myxococcales bacterium]|nr:MAG: DnaJ domain-containing protein [Myxococcales bacterium]